MYKKRILLIIFLTLFLTFPQNIFSQPNINKGYRYVLSLDNGLKRKMYANELMFDENEKYLIANYGNKPTFIVVFEVNLWKPIASFKLSNWVEFTGAYVDEFDNIYIKTSRYSSDYYKLSIKDKSIIELPCEALPKGCFITEPKQIPKTIYNKNKSFMIDINKKDSRDVRVYQLRE